MSNVFPIGIQVPLDFLIFSGGQGITGQTPYLILQRLSDGAFWDGSNSFSLTLVKVPMVELDYINRPGLYSKTFNQTIDNVPNTYIVYYDNTGIYSSSAIDELVFSFINSNANPVAIAKAVQSQIFTTSGQINPNDVASQATLSAVSSTLNNLSNVTALQSTLLTFQTNTTNTLNTILGIIQPISGPNQVTFSVLDQNLLPVPDVFLSIKNTTNQITLATGATNINGQLTLGLPSGTYNLLPFKPFYSFGTLPIQFTVTTNQTVTINSTSFVPTAPSPNLCSLYSYILDAQGNPISNIVVRMKYVTNYPFSGGNSSLITKDWAETTTDGTGYWTLNAIQGATMELNIPDINISISEFKVPVQTNLDVSTLLDYNN